MHANRPTSWYFDKKISIAIVLVIISWVVGGTAMAVQQAQANIYQDIRIDALEKNVDKFAQLVERIVRLEENQKIQIELQQHAATSLDKINDRLTAIQQGK